MPAITLDREIVQEALDLLQQCEDANVLVDCQPVITKLSAALAQPNEPPVTGRSDGLSQDYNLGLAKWFTSKPGAKQEVREALAQPERAPEYLLRKPVKHISELGPCHCPPGRCSAPVIMGVQTMCLRDVPGPETDLRGVRSDTLNPAPANAPILYSGAEESPPVFGRRWKLAIDGFGLQRDDENGNYVHIDDALSVLHQAVTSAPAKELSDEDRLDAWRSVDPETKRLPPGFKAFAIAIEAKIFTTKGNQNAT